MPATAPRRMIAVMILIPLVSALALWAFAWPAARIAPRDLPVGIAGSASATGPLEQRFETAYPGAFDLHHYGDEAAARSAIKDRVVYGAVVITPAGTRLLTASAASPVVAQLLTQAVADPAAGGVPVAVTDVVPTPAGDPRGSALGASILPLALAGVMSGVVVTVLGLRGVRAVVPLIGAAAAAGIVATALAHSWLGVLAGDRWAEAGAIGLTVLAIGAGIAGMATLIGKAGLGLGALLMVLLGNSFSGVTSAPQLLPAPVGAIGQWLPPGAGGSLLRSVAYFGGSAAGTPVLTLTLWAGLGLVAVLAGGRIRPSAAATPAPTAARTDVPEPVAAVG
ncbi:ABC transporter permease [Streptomyces sp. NPDC093109]|uniref:ABC transporter permease n=1 Tax=Streptomyces sp. NPDC093109 TaxID=3154977 RepID=UPI00344F6B07